MTTSQLPTVDQVIERMAALAAGLPPADGVAVFNAMYLTVTRLVRERLDAAFFDDPAAMADLDANFALRYLDAVDADRAGRRPEACWRPLFDLRATPGVHPLQYALAGMNAHIEHDLPLAVLDTCRRLGREPGQLAADYHRINDLLARVEDQVRDALLPGPDDLPVADPLMHVIGVWSIDRARDAAWASVLALWALRRLPPARALVTEALSGSVGMVSRALLTPFDPH
ncbi:MULTISPECIES: DUF5995 family protein [Kitasatospora]|uniref:Uncharacterized protein n=1 Tax=Kitasatospora setae (strain ATCC 33774 / DSM 43861 / JCM 3304 / KCC A-0304 / NBRC 14216 / KM-6054) TaxID=452652 RepID=E4N7I8_KITSK|nr:MULTISPECIES: DUF5995 family protein [Kitasatospora]BAJ27169.1 hypothetical protein KSE_13400 [Kitasatospora setae KM-6054]